MRWTNLRNRTLEAVMLLLVLAAPAWSIESDQYQALEIESDRAEFDELSGQTTYSGNVRLQQGTIGITADLLHITTANNRIVQLVATGNPASYEQQPAPDQEKVVARARHIAYNLDTEIIELRGDASLSQQNATLMGGIIYYDVRNQRLRASLDPDAGLDQNRVRVTLPPMGGSE